MATSSATTSPAPLLFAKRTPAAPETIAQYTGTDTELDQKVGAPARR